MNTRALLYAGFLTAAVAVLLATSRQRAPGTSTNDAQDDPKIAGPVTIAR